MQIHSNCPECGEPGLQIVAQDNDDVLACDSPSCRVITFGRYYG